MSKRVSGKFIAFISYWGWLGLAIAYLMNKKEKNEFAAFHIRQSLGISLTWLVLMAIAMIPNFGWFMTFVGFIFLLIMLIVGFFNVLFNRQKPVPVFGSQYEAWFKSM